MPPLSKHKTPVSSFVNSWLGCAMTLCVAACNGPGGSDPADREPVSQTTESVDESNSHSRTDADDGKTSTSHKPQSADMEDTDDDEEDVKPVARSCRTLDDCAEGEVCVLKRGDGFCEVGVAEARGPLGQPPPPVGLVEGGLNFDGEDAK